MANYIAQCRPRGVLLENVVQLTAENDASGFSDADFVRSKLQELGYHCQYHLLDSRRYGSFAERHRLYFIGTRTLQEEAADLPAAIFEGCECGPGKADACIWFDPDVLVEMSESYSEAKARRADLSSPAQGLLCRGPNGGW